MTRWHCACAVVRRESLSLVSVWIHASSGMETARRCGLSLPEMTASRGMWKPVDVWKFCGLGMVRKTRMSFVAVDVAAMTANWRDFPGRYSCRCKKISAVIYSHNFVSLWSLTSWALTYLKMRVRYQN